MFWIIAQEHLCAHDSYLWLECFMGNTELAMFSLLDPTIFLR